MKRTCKKNKTNKILCENCENFVPIGEGDHVCTAGVPVIVVEEYAPSEDYFWCHGTEFLEKRF